MKKHLFIITLILCVALITFAMSIKNTTKATAQATVQSEKTETYILTDYHGRIALFKKNDHTPLKVFNVFTQSLPQPDIELITKGIEIPYNEINKALEEYIS